MLMEENILGNLSGEKKKLSEGTCFYTGRKKVSKFIESIPTGFDNSENYIGFIYDKYKKEKPTKTNPPLSLIKFISQIPNRTQKAIGMITRKNHYTHARGEI